MEKIDIFSDYKNVLNRLSEGLTYDIKNDIIIHGII